MAPWYGQRELEVWVHPSQPNAWTVLAGAPPAIVLGAGLLEGADDSVNRFFLGRGLALLQRRLVILHELLGEEVALLLPAVVKLVYPAYEAEGVDETQLAEMTRELGRVLGKRTRQEAGPFALECVGDLRIIPVELPDRVLDLADRVGLLACGSLKSALVALCRIAGRAAATTMSGEDLLAQAQDEPRSAEILRFFVSAAHISVRERLGLASPL